MVLVVHLHHIMIYNSNVTDVQGIFVQKLVEGLWIMKGLNLGLVEALSKLAPHGVEHHFSQGTQPRIFLDLVVLQLDAFMLEVLLDVVLFGLL